MSDQPKPCPFCGNPDPYTDEESCRIFGKRTGHNFAVACSNCEVSAPGANTITEAIVAWNRREIPATQPSPDEHYDDYCIGQFAKMMSEKMAASRAKGRSGWNDPEKCSVEYLRSLLYEHLDKGDPVDVANFCMMLRHYEASTYREACNCQPQPSPDVAALVEAAEKALHDVDDLVANSEGVAGLHMNGTVADWESLLEGGEFCAWLQSLEALRAAIARLKGGA